MVELGESHFHVHDMDIYTVIVIGLGAIVGVVFLKGKPYPKSYPLMLTRPVVTDPT